MLLGRRLRVRHGLVVLALRLLRSRQILLLLGHRVLEGMSWRRWVELKKLRRRLKSRRCQIGLRGSLGRR